MALKVPRLKRVPHHRISRFCNGAVEADNARLTVMRWTVHGETSGSTSGSPTSNCPTGGAWSTEDPAHAAARETEEETGWRPGPLTPLLNVEPTAGLSDSVHHIYLADGARHIGPPEDGYESSRIEWIDLADVPAMVGRGEISSGTTIAAVLYAITRQSPGT
jgi:8-oxo-dGTP pyrophosphatase MutT (NUDIX family)